MTRTGGRLAWGALLVALVFAGWRAFTLGAADDLAITEPATALTWRADHPRANFEAAQTALRAGAPAAEVRPQILRALALDPLDGRSYRLLGELAARDGDRVAAARYYAIAGQRAPRDLPTQEWLVQDALRTRRGDEAVRHLDYLLRVEPERLVTHDPLLRSLTAFGPTQPAMLRALEARPEWRLSFLYYLFNQRGASERVAPVIAGLEASSAPLTRNERSAWIDRLASDGHPDRAYVAWADHLPAAQQRELTPLFNGNFSHEPSGSGYDWRFDSDHGAEVGLALTGGGDPALRLVFDGRKLSLPPVRQRLFLAPGPYRLSGQVRLAAVTTAQGLQWRMTCDRDPRELGASERLRGDSDWRPFTADFDVPPDCPGQWLELRVVARLPVEQRIEGEAWFDRLALARR